MTSDQRVQLAAIRTFDQLIDYLRDWMGWPIDGDDLEELTFEYTPEELGIDPKSAAAILSIKRLRPLSAAQPWGIFFVEFEPKRLPVLALRRILSRVALKKRASANRADQVAWVADDLLFISAHGADEDRQITFAHFAPASDGRDLPTLKVLGWDSRDTLLHLDGVARELTQNLAWPDDETNIEGWRTTWRGAFTLGHREVITTSEDLAIRLAALARGIRERIKAALAIETGTGPLTKLMKAFREALVHDLDADGFADMYAQTIAYGLLSARITDPKRSTLDDFAAHMRTNPFLRELMQAFLEAGGRRGKAGEAGLDFDELGFSDVVGLLDRANMDAVVRDFGDRNPQEDPVIHFYEVFLREYDNDQKVKRGVFYTPRPVVSYIVRSVDELLRTEFGLEDGLADTASWGEMAKRHQELTIPDRVSPEQDFVQILDPATGTGTFLVEVIDVIRNTLVAKWKAQGHSEKQIDGLWNAYVPKHLLTRLHGYELLMAPYAIAHLKIGLKLYETGYRFGSDERARVYLTNALEPAGSKQIAMDFIPALAHESQAVNAIKAASFFTVILGNPPYSIVSLNSGPWITKLMRLYKDYVRGEKNLQPLSDDYLKFIRFSQHLIEKSQIGLISMITNHTYLSGVIHRGVRKSLLELFDRIDIIDLHGSVLLGLRPAEGKIDQNVFDIQQGVSISTFSKTLYGKRENILRRTDIEGPREAKHFYLIGRAPLPPFSTIKSTQPFFFFFSHLNADDTYRSAASVAQLFTLSSAGFVTGRDEALIAIDRLSIEALINDLANTALNDQDIAMKYRIENTSGWPVSQRRRTIAGDPQRMDKIRQIAYRPFDNRFTHYSNFLQRSRLNTFRHLQSQNIALIVARLIKGETPAHVFITRLPTEKIFLSPKTSNNAFIFPLYIQSEANEKKLLTIKHSAINQKEARNFASLVDLDWRDDEAEDFSDKILTPLALTQYVYSILFSPTYRTLYAEALKVDFPRIPFTKNVHLLRALVEIGAELSALHLMESPNIEQFTSSYVGPCNPKVGRIGWSENNVWLDAVATKKGQPTKSGTVGFKGVAEDVWNFYIGGYQVCAKWLKDRKGRTLSDEDIAHYQKIVVAIAETIRLMAEIDAVIEAHGGWPGAFVTGAPADE